MRIGCLILSVPGILLGIFVILASFNPNSSPNLLWPGLAIVAICCIYIFRWFATRSKQQQHTAYIEQLEQQMQPEQSLKEQPPDSQQRQWIRKQEDE